MKASRTNSSEAGTLAKGGAALRPSVSHSSNTKRAAIWMKASHTSSSEAGTIIQGWTAPPAAASQTGHFVWLHSTVCIYLLGMPCQTLAHIVFAEGQISNQQRPGPTLQP